VDGEDEHIITVIPYDHDPARDRRTGRRGPGPFAAVGRWLRAHWMAILGWGVSAAALWYVLSRTQLSVLKEELSGVTWWLIAAAVVVQILPRVLETVRWQWLLRPIPTRFVRLLQTVYIGTLCSTILPLSGGDVVRATLVARDADVTFGQVLSTEVLERVLDVVAIILVVWFALRGLALPRELQTVRIVLQVAAGVAVIGCLIVTIRRVDLVARLTTWHPFKRPGQGLRSAGLDLVRTIGWARPRALAVAAAATLATSVVNIAAYWLLLRAYHLPLSPAQAASLFAIVTIGSLVAGTPGHIGSWQFFCAVGLQIFGVSSAQATGFSLMAWFVLAIPPMLMGVVALLTSSFAWSELRVIGRPAQTHPPAGERA
jgi:uncharacterized membrane protein YbhN (UPF0104 family)